MEVCSNGPGHMTKIAAMPIYGKNPLKYYPEPKGLGKKQLGCRSYQICSYDDPSYL